MQPRRARVHPKSMRACRHSFCAEPAQVAGAKAHLSLEAVVLIALNANSSTLVLDAVRQDTHPSEDQRLQRSNLAHTPALSSALLPS